jgi:phage terminase large subunit-like protein
MTSQKKRATSKSQSLGKPSNWRSARNIAWIEKHLRVPEGSFVGKPLVLPPYMREDLEAIYDNPHGTRRVIISRGRKNAKTTESAMLELLHLCGPEARPNSQLFSAAQSRDQAAILFSLAAKMVRMSPTLNGFVVIRDTAKQLACPELGTLYRALSADASTAYGLSPALAVHDELGQVKGPKSELYDAIETAAGAQAEPLSIIISTQAPDDADLLSVLIDDAMTGSDPRTVLRFQTAPDNLETFSEEAIRAANPAFDYFMNKQEVIETMEKARRMPTSQASYENLILNRRVEANSPFVSRELWKLNGALPVDDFDGLEVFAGLDLSSVQDLTAFVRVAKHQGKWSVKPTFWLPEFGLKDKARQDKVPYDVWASQGQLETTPGKAIDYEFVAKLIADEHSEIQFRKIAFDRWNFRHMKPCLQRAGFTDEELEGDDAIFVEFGQGFQSMSPALRSLETLILNEQVAHGNHPVLTWNASNAVVKSDPAGNRKLDKSKSHGRIDGMVALAMAVSVAGADIAAEPKVILNQVFII